MPEETTERTAGIAAGDAAGRSSATVHGDAADRSASRGRVRVLDEHIANKIAAGEVIERPASVVKELVENAIDAHATRVEVIVEDGGKSLIRVTDDGWGIGADDLSRIFLPHATSKLTDVEDLDGIATLGFRGEALASIGAVAHVRVRSRERADDNGHEVENRGGTISAVCSAGAARGTEIVARNLFFNTPARLRFLRADRTEAGHIEERLRQMALAHPEIGFRLTVNGSEKLRADPGESMRERIATLMGREWADSLIDCSVELPTGRMDAFLAPPDRCRSHTRDLRYFVNGRPIQDRILHRVVRDVYRDAIHPGRFPVALLFFHLDPASIDVNVHPTKSEIRWRDARFLHSVVAPTLSRALRAADLSARMDVDRAATLEDHSTSYDRRTGVQDALRDFLERSRSTDGNGEVREPSLPSVHTPAAYSVLQMHDSYLVCEVDDGIAIVDQHALHERVQYDRIIASLERNGVDTQSLLVPEQVELDAAGIGLLQEHAALLERSGFRWSPFGDKEIALEAIPAVLSRTLAAEVLGDLVELLRQRGAQVDARTLFHEVADTMACKAAIRFGDRIGVEEARALLDESGALSHAFVCPHGRPTVLRLPFAELERRFGRR